MKKKILTLTIMIACVAMVAAFCGTGYAAVTGACVDCHTMHNSQNSTSMASGLDGNPTADTFAHLTLSSCIGCHSGTDSTATVGGAPSVTMSYTAAANDVSAGGSFGTSVWSASNTINDARVHNVIITGLTITADSVHTNIPGASAGMNNGVGANTASSLTCAGVNGCHGTIDDVDITDPDAGIRGFHHDATSPYRYLKITDGKNVTGEGSDNWEDGTGSLGGASGTNHNVYSASTTNGINKFCANCHPDFHGSGASSNTQDASLNWIRHPTDNELDSTDWDLEKVDIDYKRNPFAWQTLDQNDPETAYPTPANLADSGASVSCLSCHRAHGTPYADLLRFEYSGQSAGSTTTTGCLGCHYKQRILSSQ